MSILIIIITNIANTLNTFVQQMLMSVLQGAIHVMIMQTVMILMVVTCVSAGQDSREMDTTVQVT